MNTNDKVEKTSEEQWDETLNSPESLEMLEMLSNDALAGFENGEFLPMDFTEEKPKAFKVSK